jgi:hypothetical protein
MEFKIICRYHPTMHENPQGTDFIGRQVLFLFPYSENDLNVEQTLNIIHFQTAGHRTARVMGKAGAHDDLTPNR